MCVCVGWSVRKGGEVCARIRQVHECIQKLINHEKISKSFGVLTYNEYEWKLYVLCPV